MCRQQIIHWVRPFFEDSAAEILTGAFRHDGNGATQPRRQDLNTVSVVSLLIDLTYRCR